MRVLVDTSAWPDLLNGHPSPAADALAELRRGDDDACTCGIVVAEVFQGLRSIAGESGCAVLARGRDMDAILGSGLLKAPR